MNESEMKSNPMMWGHQVYQMEGRIENCQEDLKTMDKKNAKRNDWRYNSLLRPLKAPDGRDFK